MKKHLFLFMALGALIFAQVMDRQIEATTDQIDKGEQALTVLEPGEFVGTVALGGFRMIAVNILWVRALDNQEDDKHFSALADAELITKLQPNVPSVWSFIAWNLGYNISVLENSEEEGYQWVQSGIVKLREGCDRAKQSKKIWELRRDLGWFYYHRVGPGFEGYNRKFKEDKELNPKGLDPLFLAVEEFDKACSHPDHSFMVDLLLYRASLDSLVALDLTDEERAQFHQRIKRVKSHIQEDHPDPQLSHRLSTFDQQYKLVLQMEQERR